MITDELRDERLLKLADYLEALPEDYEHFDMGYYLAEPSPPGPTVVESYECLEKDCGFVACAVGHMPLALGITKDDESWFEYLDRVIGLRWTDMTARWGFAAAWMFSYNWVTQDNTAKGAANRIRFYVEVGVPLGWDWPDDKTPDFDAWVAAR